MREVNQQVVYVIRGTSGFPIDVVYGERLDDRRFAIRHLELDDRWRIDHIVTGTSAFTAKTYEEALGGFDKLLREKGEGKLTEALDKSIKVIRAYEESLA